MGENHPLERLLNPKSIAIIGAGDNPLRINGRTLMFMLRHRSGAKLLPVNPNRDEVQGIPCYRCIQDLPETPDVGMVMWILLGATLFSNLYRAMGAQDLVMGVVVDKLRIGRWGVLIIMQFSLFILGCLMDDYAIVLLCAPIYVPIIKTLGFDSLWFSLLFMVNMQMAYLTPPYGVNLFYMKSITPPDITMGDIYRSVVPFVALQMLGLILVMVFPPLAVWLPRALK